MPFDYLSARLDWRILHHRIALFSRGLPYAARGVQESYRLRGRPNSKINTLAFASRDIQRRPYYKDFSIQGQTIIERVAQPAMKAKLNNNKLALESNQTGDVGQPPAQCQIQALYTVDSIPSSVKQKRRPRSQSLSKSRQECSVDSNKTHKCQPAGRSRARPVQNSITQNQGRVVYKYREGAQVQARPRMTIHIERDMSQQDDRQ